MKSTGKNLPAVLAECLIVLLAMSSAVSGQSRSAGRTLTKEQLDEVKKNAVDLRPILERKRLREGLNKIYTYDSGIELSAKVKKGKVVAWVATDAKGKGLKTVLYNYNSPGEPAGWTFCLVCVWIKGTNTEGVEVLQERCSQFPCWILY